MDHIWCAPGNGGIAAEAECVPIKATDIDGMVAFAKEHKPDLVMVAPDDPLALGMVDALEAVGIRAFGPRKNAAIIEGSKSFAKDLMQKYNIPTAGYAVFENSADAIEYIKKNGAPIVVKADGLALGKGVTVAMTEEEAIEAVKDAIDGGIRRCRCACRYRGIPDRSGGFRARLRRRQAPQDHAVRTGSQACLRP